MAFWNYVIYHVSDFASLDFAGPIVTNATLNPIYITVEDDDPWFNQTGGDTGMWQTVSSSSDPSLVGQFAHSEVYASWDQLHHDTGAGMLTFSRISIGGVSDYVMMTGDPGVSPFLSPGTSYSEDGGILSNTSWAHSTSNIACFTTGTRIATPDGDAPIEALKAGDRVVTADHGPQRIRWIGRRTVSPGEMRQAPALRPIRIAAGAMGGGLPARDLMVSRQHRMLLRSAAVERLYGTPEVLIPAVKLVGLPGIRVETPAAGVTYMHILCQRHEVVFAEGCPAESLYLGPQLFDPAADEAFAMFPGLRTDNLSLLPARLLARGRRASRLGRALAGGGAPLLDTAPGPEVPA